jgi:formylglycine-generating enzyme required for sulfatase activity
MLSKDKYPMIVLFSLICGACSPLQAPEISGLENMVVIPAGWFWMGSDGGRPSNRPLMYIYLDTFAIDRTEVTVGSFGRFLDEQQDVGPTLTSEVLTSNPNDPVTGVTWEVANSFCRWMGKRLPTEAEWEKAARGSDGRSYPWGDDWDTRNANTLENGQNHAVPVGSYPHAESPYGVLDMSGNAAEWIADYYDPVYYDYGPRVNPRGPSEVLDHSLRGGSWDSSAGQATTYFRNSSHSVLPDERVGFRCARSSSQQ